MARVLQLGSHPRSRGARGSLEPRVAEAAGVSFSAHDLRRTLSNLLSPASEVGTGDAFMKMAMNHTAADDVTATHYLDKVEQLRPIYERLEQVISDKVGVFTRKTVTVDAEAFARFLALEEANRQPAAAR